MTGVQTCALPIFPISIPGLKLPQGDIPNGGSAVATIPPLAFTIDGTQKGVVTMTALKYTMSFQLPSNVKDVSLDGASLLNKTSEVHLSEKDSHILVLKCL